MKRFLLFFQASWSPLSARNPRLREFNRSACRRHSLSIHVNTLATRRDVSPGKPKTPLFQPITYHSPAPFSILSFQHFSRVNQCTHKISRVWLVNRHDSLLTRRQGVRKRWNPKARLWRHLAAAIRTYGSTAWSGAFVLVAAARWHQSLSSGF